MKNEHCHRMAVNRMRSPPSQPSASALLSWSGEAIALACRTSWLQSRATVKEHTAITGCHHTAMVTQVATKGRRWEPSLGALQCQEAAPYSIKAEEPAQEEEQPDTLGTSRPPVPLQVGTVTTRTGKRKPLLQKTLGGF